MGYSPIISPRRKPEKAVRETIRKDLSISNLTMEMCKNRTCWDQNETWTKVIDEKCTFA